MGMIYYIWGMGLQWEKNNVIADMQYGNDILYMGDGTTVGEEQCHF